MWTLRCSLQEPILQWPLWTSVDNIVVPIYLIYAAKIIKWFVAILKIHNDSSRRHKSTFSINIYYKDINLFFGVRSIKICIIVFRRYLQIKSTKMWKTSAPNFLVETKKFSIFHCYFNCTGRQSSIGKSR